MSERETMRTEGGRGKDSPWAIERGIKEEGEGRKKEIEKSGVSVDEK